MLQFGLTEILIVNIFIIKRTVNARIDPGQYRWDLVFGLVTKAKALESRDTDSQDVNVESGPRRSVRQRGGETPSSASDNPVEVVPRFEGVGVHHHDRLREYVTPPEEAERNQRIVDANKPTRDYNRKPRQRDSKRKLRKVRNPLFTSASLCLVCKYQYGRRKETLKYCRECCVEKFTN